MKRRHGFLEDGQKMRLISLCILVAIIFSFGLTGCKKNAGKDAAVGGAVLSDGTVPNIPPASEENNLFQIAVNARGTDGKVCYLTFDDGPTTDVTPKVLDVLKEYDVKATFFLLGTMIEKNPDLAKRVYEEGHLLANHSYSHQYDKLYVDGNSFMEEIRKVEELIRDVTGEEPFKLMRFPGGSNSGGEYGDRKQQYKELLKENGYYYVDWNSLNGDAESRTPSPDYLVTRLKETAIHQHLVVLMHDANTKTTTPEALPEIIEYLREEGYEFRRLDEIPYYNEEEIKEMKRPNMDL